MIRKTLNKEQGFTLIEMLVIAPIVILAIGAFLTVIISMTGEVIASRASNALSYNVQDALNRIEQDVKLSASFLSVNKIALSAPNAQGYNDDATNFNNATDATGAKLILNMVATSGNPLSTTSSYVFLKDKPNPCASAQNNIPLTYNVVYFVKHNDTTNTDVLWRRTIMPANYTDTNYRCVAPWQLPSCSPSYMATHSGVFCKTNDIKLVEGNSLSFLLQYFNGASTTIANTDAVTSTDASVRQTALDSATTLGVAIDASQTTAGREVERSAVLRVSRLDRNASAIATLTTDTTPSAPVVTGNPQPGAKVKFSWPAVSGATGYTFEYRFNNTGSWTASFTNQNTRTATVSATYNSIINSGASSLNTPNIVNARVTAHNSSASPSSYGTKSVTVPQWEPLIMQNNWVNYDVSFTPAQYTRTRAGVVVLEGLIANTGSISSEQVIGVLPPGFRPSADLFVATMGGSAWARLRITADGEIRVLTGSATWTSLSGISFMANGAYTPTAINSFNASWVNYGVDPYGTPGWARDSEGRMYLQGLIKSGTTTNNTVIYTIPSGSPSRWPVAYAYMPVVTNTTTISYLLVDPGSGAISILGASSGYLSLSNQFYTSTKGDSAFGNYGACRSNWCTPSSNGTAPTYSASWVPYDTAAHRYAQFTQDSDGMVTLRGLLKSGTVTANTPIFNLPEGFRPSAKMIFTNVCNGAICRIDVLPNGDVVTQTGVSATWSSFDNIRFMPDQ